MNTDPRDFPPGIRGALLNWISLKGGAKPQHIWRRFAQHAGYGSVAEYLTTCETRYGAKGAKAIRDQIEAQWEILVEQVPRTQTASASELRNIRADTQPQLALLAMPDEDFKIALERGLLVVLDRLQMIDSGMPPSDNEGYIVEHVNGLFARRGVPYRLTRELELERQGDSGVDELVTRPALDALVDPRLAGARTEYEDALVKLRLDGAKDLEDAIEESRKAVESALKVLIDESGLGRARGDSTSKLIETLVVGRIVEREADDLLRAASRIANEWGSHGAGSHPRATRRDLATAAVSAAGVAVAFLAARLP